MPTAMVTAPTESTLQHRRLLVSVDQDGRRRFTWQMPRIIRGSPTVSTYQDSNGNFRAMNAHHLGFVAYGRTHDEAVRNLNDNIGQRPASAREQIAALFMMLGTEQRATLEELPTLGRS